MTQQLLEQYVPLSPVYTVIRKAGLVINRLCLLYGELFSPAAAETFRNVFAESNVDLPDNLRRLAVQKWLTIKVCMGAVDTKQQ